MLRGGPLVFLLTPLQIRRAMQHCLVDHSLVRHGLVSKHCQKIHALIAGLVDVFRATLTGRNLGLIKDLARHQGLTAEARQVRILRRVVNAVADPVVLARLVPAESGDVMAVPIVDARLLVVS